MKTTAMLRAMRAAGFLAAAMLGGAAWTACGGEGSASATTGGTANEPTVVTVMCAKAGGYAVASFPGRSVEELRSVRATNIYHAPVDGFTEMTLPNVELADTQARVHCLYSGSVLFTLP